MEPLDATSSVALNFTFNLYRELDGLQADDWIHVGGDEVALNCWKSSTRVRHWLKRHNMSTPVELLDYFESRLLSFVSKSLGKKPVVWQELFESGVRLPEETVVDVWQNWNDIPVRERATQEHDILVSSCWYLDHLDEDWLSFYRCNPRGFNGTMEQKQRVMGGHSSMWGERCDEQNFMPRVWPRASATAEKLWSGENDNASQTATARLDRFRCLMVQRGFGASPIQPGTCDQDLESLIESERRAD
jgi:hexosaminidase